MAAHTDCAFSTFSTFLCWLSSWEKRQMKLLKALSITFGVIVIAAALMGFGVVLSYRLNGWVWNQQYTQGYADRDAYLPPIEDIQKRIGAKIDGIWGEETNRLYDKALCDQYAMYGFNPKIREFDKAMLVKVEVEK